MDTVDDGRILEQEDDDESLWWERYAEDRCSRCGSRNIGHTDYQVTEDGDEILLSPYCYDCHYDWEQECVRPPKPLTPDPNMQIEGAFGSYVVRYKQDDGTWSEPHLIWTWG